MKLIALCFCIAICTPGALSALVAGPYQMITYWFTYRMEIQALGLGNTKIAPGCRGTVGDGSCYFDELMKYLNPEWEGSTTIGTNLDPDVDTAFQDLKQSKWSPDARILFPHEFGSMERGKTPPFPKVWGAVGDSIEACRKKLGDSKVAEQLKKVRYCFTMVHYARISEQAEHMITGVNESLQRRGKTFKVQTKTITKAGISWEEIDAAKTLATCNGCNQKLHDAILNWPKQGANQKERKLWESHDTAIQSAQAEETRLQQSLPC